MIGLHEWATTVTFPDRPWLMLGKGPTFSRRAEFDLGSFNTIALNHVVQTVPVDIAHVVDLDVVVSCADAIRANCRYLVMPRHPHVACAPSSRRLEDFFDAVPVLRELDEAGRLVWYSSSQAPVPGAGPHLPLRFFGSEGALGVLATLGAKDVRTLGVDGGRDYDRSFEHLDDVTKLANGQPSFDLQFAELEAIRRRHGMSLTSLIPALRVFVGTAERDLPAFRTLADSIISHSSVPVQVTPLTDVRLRMPRSRANRPRTPFSFARFAIPELCGHEGRAIYLDSDMLVFGDIAELADLPFDDAHLMCSYQDAVPDVWSNSTWFHAGPQFSVMVLDCERLDWDVQAIVDGLDAGRYTYRDLLFEMCVVEPDRVAHRVPPVWNHLEHYEAGITKLVHYTVVPLQPWRSSDNPLGPIWERAFRDAVHAGAVPYNEVHELVRSGEVKRSLLEPFEDIAGADGRSPDGIVASELQEVRRELARVQARTVRGRVRRGAKAAWPLVRRVRDRWPGSPIGTCADQLHEVVRTKL